MVDDLCEEFVKEGKKLEGILNRDYQAAAIAYKKAFNCYRAQDNMDKAEKYLWKAIECTNKVLNKKRSVSLLDLLDYLDILIEAAELSGDKKKDFLDKEITRIALRTANSYQFEHNIRKALTLLMKISRVIHSKDEKKKINIRIIELSLMLADKAKNNLERAQYLQIAKNWLERIGKFKEALEIKNKIFQLVGSSTDLEEEKKKRTIESLNAVIPYDDSLINVDILLNSIIDAFSSFTDIHIEKSEESIKIARDSREAVITIDRMNKNIHVYAPNRMFGLEILPLIKIGLNMATKTAQKIKAEKEKAIKELTVMSKKLIKLIKDLITLSDYCYVQMDPVDIKAQLDKISSILDGIQGMKAIEEEINYWRKNFNSLIGKKVDERTYKELASQIEKWISFIENKLM